MHMRAILARFAFETCRWVQQLRPGIVPSLGECDGKDGVYRRGTRRM